MLAHQQAGTLPVAVETYVEQFLAARQVLLDARLRQVDADAAAGSLPEATMTNGVLKTSPLDTRTPPEAEALAVRLHAMLPRVRITDLLTEVAGWPVSLDCSTHLRTGETPADSRVLMA